MGEGGWMGATTEMRQNSRVMEQALLLLHATSEMQQAAHPILQSSEISSGNDEALQGGPMVT